MIVDFGSKDTERVWMGFQVRRWSRNVQIVARRKLRMLNNSQNIADLGVPSSNRLEKLKGKMKDYHSIRINKQWRITFRWQRGNAASVEIVDYHK